MKKLLKIALTLMATFCMSLSIFGIIGWNNASVTAEAATNLGAFDVGLNMQVWALGNNGVMSAYNSKYLYLNIENGSTIPYGGDGTAEDWSVSYTSVGDAVKVNGVAKETKIVKTHADGQAALALLEAEYDLGTGTIGDTLTIDGDFTNDTYGTFTINDATFVYDGHTWMEDDTVSYSFDSFTRMDETPQSGFYASMGENDILVGTDWQYWTNPCASDQYILTSGDTSTVFSGNLCKFSETDWYISFGNAEGGIYEGGTVAPQNGDLITFGGWFYCSGGGFIKIANTQYEYVDGTWTNVTPSISVQLNDTEITNGVISVAPGTAVDEITATSSSGIVAPVYEFNAVSDGKFALRAGESISDYRAMFSVEKDLGSKTVYFTKETVIRVGFEDFVMEEGASVRVVNDNVNGLRFIAEFSTDTYNSLTSQNATYGMVIVPRDYITAGYELTVDNLFGNDAKYVEGDIESVPDGKKLMLNIMDLVPKDIDKDGRYEIYGAITDILTKNLTREFVGIAYAKVNSGYILASYYANEMENNARSIYYVSQKAIDANDNASLVQEKYIDAYDSYVSSLGKTYNRTYTVNYITTVNGKSSVETETVTAALNSEINLTAKEISGFKVSSASTIKSKVYANKDNVFNFYYMLEDAVVFDSVAWYHPQLDSSNNYDNATNDAIAKTMKDAGFTTVILAGAYNIVLESDENVQITRWVIDMFYRNGIKSIVCLPNWTNNENYALDYLPDFSNHEGFAGFSIWDEPLPSETDLNTVAEYAEWYKTVYADEEGVAPFMINLNPSYCPYLGESGYYGAYAEYVKAYCDIVLSKFDGTNYEKFLSVDTYPIKSDGTLRNTFLYDIAVLKAYAMNYGAHTHVALQACGWDDTPDDGNRADYDTAPTEEQMRLQLYTALAFGVDSLSWWAYHPLDIVVDAPLNKDGTTTAVYDSIQNINNELATFGSLYKNYDWKGVIMSDPSSGFFGLGADAQYEAYKKVKDESVFSNYLLSSIKDGSSSFSSITGSGSNYIMSVMQNADGDEAFAIVNYSAVKDNKTLTLTLTGKQLGQYALYQNGEMQTITIDESGYTLTLAPGEGAFLVEANSEHTVTFKNYDGTVLQEETLTFGSVPTYKGAVPTRRGYTFTGWTPTIGAISGDTVYTALFDPIFETYTTGDIIGGENGYSLDSYAISMTELEGKALHFEFKFVEDGSFSFAILANDWANITGTVTITKSGDNITAEINSNGALYYNSYIIALEDGWYAWELNAKEFVGDGASRATEVGLIYSNTAVTGTVMINFTSFAVVDRIGMTFTEGEVIGGTAGYLLGSYAVPMTELSGKALHFEFKFETDGSFNICLLAADWANVTGYFTVTKSGDNVTTTVGRLVDLGDGWYAWEQNASDFAGDGVARAADIGLVYSTTGVTGTVMIDFTSFTAVNMYRTGTTFTEGEVIGGTTGYLLGVNAVPMTSLENKALHFEFKFETDGSFNICLLAADWANVTGYFTVTKSGDSVTATVGRIVDLGDSWYAWEQNASDFAGDGVARAADIGLIYSTVGVTGTVIIDFTSFEAVDRYRMGTTFTEGEVIGGTAGYQLGSYAVPMTELSGKALHFEFKFETDGSFNICLLAADWANVTGYFTVTKSGDSVTTTIGRIVDLGDSWYAWEQNASDFAGDGAARATEVGLIYTTATVTGTVTIDFTSFVAVNRCRTNTTTYAEGEVIGGTAGYQLGSYAVPMTELSGKALHFEFTFEGDGAFTICILANDWANVTGYFTVTKSGDSVTATTGRIVDLGDGWYAWEQNTSDFAGDGAARATEVGLIYTTATVTGTVEIDWASMSAVDAY